MFCSNWHIPALRFFIQPPTLSPQYIQRRIHQKAVSLLFASLLTIFVLSKGLVLVLLFYFGHLFVAHECNAAVLVAAHVLLGLLIANVDVYVLASASLSF